MIVYAYGVIISPTSSVIENRIESIT